MMNKILNVLLLICLLENGCLNYCKEVSRLEEIKYVVEKVWSEEELKKAGLTLVTDSINNIGFKRQYDDGFGVSREELKYLEDLASNVNYKLNTATYFTIVPSLTTYSVSKSSFDTLFTIVNQKCSEEVNKKCN